MDHAPLDRGDRSPQRPRRHPPRDDRRPDRRIAPAASMERVVLETERLLLREMAPDDLGELSEILGDSETMRFYPHPFNCDEAAGWIEWCRRSYRDHGYGLWALILKDTGEFVGDCGLTLQDVDGEKLVEVGYHVKKIHWRKGLATEAALACRDYAFAVVGVDRLIAPGAGGERTVRRRGPQARNDGVEADHAGGGPAPRLLGDPLDGQPRLSPEPVDVGALGPGTRRPGRIRCPRAAPATVEGCSSRCPSSRSQAGSCRSCGRQSAWSKTHAPGRSCASSSCNG